MKSLRTMVTTTTGRSWLMGVLLVLGLALVALSAREALAQEVADAPFDLVGTVTDVSGRPLVGAFVSLAASDWGSLTNEQGRFAIPRVRPGEVTITAELIGYETLTWSGAVAAGEGLALKLTSQPILLEGLNVVTDRFESRRRAVASSVRWFDQRALSTSTLPTALDFVTTRVGLHRVGCNGRTTNQCVMVRGRAAEPRVYVDEVPVFGGMEYLEVIQPHELYMLEVYGNGRHIRAYTNQFMERAAKSRLMPIPLIW